MQCLSEARFTTEELVAAFVCAIRCAGQLWFLHPGWFPFCQGVVHTVQLHTGYGSAAHVDGC